MLHNVYLDCKCFILDTKNKRLCFTHFIHGFIQINQLFLLLMVALWTFLKVKKQIVHNSIWLLRQKLNNCDWLL